MDFKNIDLSKIKVMETNSALGYMEYAIFVQINEKEMLCVFTNECGYEPDFSWRVGHSYEMFDFETEYDSIIDSKKEMVLKNSPLNGTFLYQNFLESFK